LLEKKESRKMELKKTGFREGEGLLGRNFTLCPAKVEKARRGEESGKKGRVRARSGGGRRRDGFLQKSPKSFGRLKRPDNDLRYYYLDHTGKKRHREKGKGREREELKKRGKTLRIERGSSPPWGFTRPNRLGNGSPAKTTKRGQGGKEKREAKVWGGPP